MRRTQDVTIYLYIIYKIIFQRLENVSNKIESQKIKKFYPSNSHKNVVDDVLVLETGPGSDAIL